MIFSIFKFSEIFFLKNNVLVPSLLLHPLASFASNDPSSEEEVLQISLDKYQNIGECPGIEIQNIQKCLNFRNLPELLSKCFQCLTYYQTNI